MKRGIAALLLVLGVAGMESCREDPVDIVPKIEYNDFHGFSQGEEQPLSTMCTINDQVYIFSQSASNYYLHATDIGFTSFRSHEYPFPLPGFLPEKLLSLGGDKLFLAGSKDGHPAWSFTDTTAGNGLFFRTYAENKGKVYDALEFNNHLYLCGELQQDTDRQAVVFKVNPNGYIVDTLIFGTDQNDGAVDLMEDNGKLYLLCYSYGKGIGDRDAWVMELSENLETSNQRVYGGTGYEQPEMLLAFQNVIYVCGHTTSFNDPMHDAWFLCLEKDLSLRWEKNVNNNGHEGADYMDITPEGNIAWCSYGDMSINRGYLGLISAEGAVLDQKKFDGYVRFTQLKAYSKYVIALGPRNDDKEVYPALHRYTLLP